MLTERKREIVLNAMVTKEKMKYCVELIDEIIPVNRVLFATIFGSQLYGINTEKSDLDIKGIYMPTLEQYLLGTVKRTLNVSSGNDNSKNTFVDYDVELISFNYFIELACQGQTNVLDMLNSESYSSMIILRSNVWQRIIDNKDKFLQKNLSAFLGYAKTQAAKYGVKGSRLNECTMVINWLLRHDQNAKLKEHWNDFPKGEHIEPVPPTKENNFTRGMKVCGRTLQETVTFEYAKNIVSKYHQDYGKRAILASKNEGVDWKAVSHALRAAYELKEIFESGNIKFPLKESEFLLGVKEGKFDYQTIVAPKLEELINDVNELSTNSDYPSTVDRIFWENFILEEIKNFHNIK